jgi:hypothetical protein
MSVVCLVKVSPLNINTGLREDVYLSSVDDRRVVGLNSHIWEPAITTQPSIGIALWNGDFAEAVTPAAAAVPVNLKVLENTYPNVTTFIWNAAPMEIYYGTPGDSWPWTTIFSGRVKSYGGRYPTILLQAEVDSEPFSVNVLNLSYQGTGDIEGGEDIENRLKPLVLGHAKNVEPVLINATYSVYQFTAYHALSAIAGLYERGSAFPAANADYANYAALVAATIPPGEWATCLASGLIRLGAPAYGVITGDVEVEPRSTADIIAQVADIAGISSSLLDTDTLDALNTAVPWAINVVVTDQEKFIDFAKRLALACNWQVGISLTGKFFVSAVTMSGSSQITLHAQGQSLPQVTQVDEVDVSPPYAKTTMGAARCWRVHTSDEIAFGATMVDRGLFDVAETYREGNIVDRPDGSRWLYIATDPSSGNTPPDWPTASDAYWSNHTPPLSAAIAGYLTNESHTVVADSSGTVSSFTGAGGEFRVIQGSTDITAFCDFAVESETGVDVTINATTGVYTVNSMSASQGTAVFRATYGDVTIDKVYSISKAIGGAGATLFRMSATRSQVKYDQYGTLISGQIVDFYTERQNTTANLIVRIYRVNSAGTLSAIDAGVYLSGSGTVTQNVPDSNAFTQTGSTISLSGSSFNSAISGGYVAVVLQVTCGSVTESATVFKVSDGTPSFNVFMTPQNATVPSDSAGTVSDWGNAEGQLSAYDGTGNEILTEATISAATGLNATGTVNTATNTPIAGKPKGFYRITALAAEYGRIGIPITYRGTTVTVYFSVTKARSGTPAKLLQVSPSQQTISYDKDGVIIAGQSVTFTATKTNTTSDLIVKMYRLPGTQIDAGVYLTGSGTVTQNVPDANSFTQTGDTVTMTGANFDAAIGSAKGVVVAIYCDDLRELITITKIQDGSDAYTGFLTNESHQVVAGPTGVVSSYSGATGDFKIFKGATDVSSSFTLSTLQNAAGLTVSYSGRTYTVSGGLASGTDVANLAIRATGSGAHSGVTVDKTFSLSKSKQGATGDPGDDGLDALDVALTKSMITLPVDGSNAVTSYALATGSFTARLPDGTDVSSNFSLATASGGNPQTLTVAYSGQTFTISGGFDTGEDSATLTIVATGSGAYTGFSYRRTVTLSKSVANTNVSNDRISTALVTPTVASDGSAFTAVSNADSSVNITFKWGWSGTEADIDGFEIIIRSSRDSNATYVLNSAPAEEQIFTAPAVKRAFTINGLPSNLWYSFFVRAFRIVDTDINVAGIMRSSAVFSSGASQHPYRPASTPNYTGQIAGTTAAVVAQSSADFNASNNQNGDAILAPTVPTNGTGIDHSPNTDGSVDIVFRWAWAGTEADIDGFHVFIYSSTSNGAYSIGGNPTLETVYVTSANKRAIVFSGMSADLYYTFGVRAYRRVDTNVNAAGIMVSSIVSPTNTGELRYQPASTVAFAGNITGTINGTSAATVATGANSANSGLNSDGTVKTDKVATAAIQASAVHDVYTSQFSSPISVSDGLDEDLLSITRTLSVGDVLIIQAAVEVELPLSMSYKRTGAELRLSSAPAGVGTGFLTASTSSVQLPSATIGYSANLNPVYVLPIVVAGSYTILLRGSVYSTDTHSFMSGRLIINRIKR